METGLLIVLVVVGAYLCFVEGVRYGASIADQQWMNWLGQHVKVRSVQSKDLYPEKDNE